MADSAGELGGPMNGPEGVQIHRADGTVLDAELFDEGVDREGMHNWRIANAVYQIGDQVTCRLLPGRTSIGFTAHVPRGTQFEISGEPTKPKRRWWK